ncbi:cupredoxin domain-containing protein [Azospirillum sp.]|uniref:cupredoxin domain-containing protein n=1 Tax=Azospirillum sp. TaxID=34012 RepID=UPI003D74D654
MRRIALSALLFASLPATAAEVAVRIDKSAFDPARITVKAGDTVTWTNAEKRTSHDVIFEDGERSVRLLPDDAWSRTFATPGRYPYHCEPHPHMKGEVVVEP